MKLKLYTLALSMALGCGTGVFAQQPATGQTSAAPSAARAETKLPSADEVLDNYIKALGGKAAVSKFKSRVSKGTVEIPQMGATGTIETSQVAPNKVVTVMNITGLGAFQTGYDGTNGWSKDPFSGLRDLKGGELHATRRGAYLDTTEWKKLYTKLTVTGRGKVGDRDVYIVEGATDGDTPDKLYFDTQNGLLLRMDSVVDSPQGRVQAESHMEDYREVDGVKVPHTVRLSLGAATIITKLTDIKHDVAVDNAIFRKPAA
jgi:hypothetical protein